jgi:hypothetical protein
MRCGLLIGRLVSTRVTIRVNTVISANIADATREHDRVNSERIRDQFGSYHVRVLEQDDKNRLASLCSTHSGSDICRTLAVTCFAKPTPPTLLEADALIRAGQSIGSTLEQAKLQISRELIAEASAQCGEAFALMSGGSVRVGEQLYVRLYRLDAGEHGALLAPYATIAEAHHPTLTPTNPEAISAEKLDQDVWSGDAILALQTLAAAL